MWISKQAEMIFDAVIEDAFSDRSPHLALAVAFMLSIDGCLTKLSGSSLWLWRFSGFHWAVFPAI